MSKTKNTEPKRKFIGDLNPKLDHSTPEMLMLTKWNRRYHQAMLKAYLKGKEFFNFGFTRNKEGYRVPQQYKVAQQYL